MTWLKNTQDNVPSEFKDAKQIRRYVSDILMSELNKEFDDVFEDFDYCPIGVASIGQVHKATLKGSHQQVAVKLQLPNMERRFRVDVSTIRMFCKLATPQFVPTFDEIERQFCTEFDYLGEARNLNEIRNLVLPRWSDRVDIPRPHMDLCSHHMLVMDFIEGVKLVDGIRAQFRALAKQSGGTRRFEEIEAERVEAVRNGSVPLQTLEDAEKQHKSIEWMVFINDWVFSINPLRWVYNHTLSPLTGEWQYQLSATPLHKDDAGIAGGLIDLAQLLRLLCDVHASEIFEAGSFNADPHPGNILLMKDGRIGLIDYGQVKTMSLKDRITYAKLMISLHRDDKEEIVRLYTQEGGMRSKTGNPHVAYLHACFYNDRDTPDITMGKNMHLFAEYLEQQDPILSLPEDFIMAGR
ncbi:ADCK1, partial [Symbiodinium microadriaticum]